MRKIHAIAVLAALSLIPFGVKLAIATTLFGGVQHTAYEAPASRYNSTFGAQLQKYQQPYQTETPGLDASAQTSFTPTFQAQPQRQVDWFKIPPWMAGTWSKRGDMTINVTDLLTGRSSNIQEWTDDELTVTWGHQLDRLGNIWEANFVPSERDALSNGKSVRFSLVECRCELTAPEQVITRMHYIVAESTGWGQAPTQFQQESLNHYSPLSANEIQNESSTRVFTYEGSPTRNGILLSKFQRLAPFQPIAMQDGVDLRQSLSQYLQAHRLEDLIPTQNYPGQNNRPGSQTPIVPEPF